MAPKPLTYFIGFHRNSAPGPIYEPRRSAPDARIGGWSFSGHGTILAEVQNSDTTRQQPPISDIGRPAWLGSSARILKMAGPRAGFSGLHEDTVKRRRAVLRSTDCVGLAT
jgi:hypothetical protein